MQDQIQANTIRLAKEGSSQALTEIYEHFYVNLFRYFYYRLGDQKLAEDLSSEVFLRMLKALPDFHLLNVPFKAWLYQIARFLVIDHVRKNHRHQEVELPEDIPSEHGHPEPTTEQKLLSQSLYSALDTLPEEQKDVLVMRFIVGLPIAEVAAAMHKSQDAIKGLQRRGIITLREKFEELELTK